MSILIAVILAGVALFAAREVVKLLAPRQRGVAIDSGFDRAARLAGKLGLIAFLIGVVVLMAGAAGWLDPFLN